MHKIGWLKQVLPPLQFFLLEDNELGFYFLQWCN